MKLFGVEHEQVRIKLNSIQLRGFENIKVGDVLYYNIFTAAGFWQGIKHIICLFYKEACKISYNIEMIGDGRTLCLFSSSCFGRKDHYDAFINVTGIIEDQISVRAETSKWYFGGTRFLKMLPGWNRKLKNVEPEFGARMLYLRMLFRAYADYHYVINNIRKLQAKPKYLLSYCDVMSVDSYFVQRFSNNKCQTITLQHGVFELLNNPWAIKGAKCDYFLALCQQTAEDLESIGFAGQVIIVGSPHQFNSPEIICSGRYKTGILGIFMNGNDHGDQGEQNRAMLSVTQEYCKLYNKKLMIKYHPANDPKVYKKLIDQSVVVNTFQQEISVAQFLERINISVCGNSTTFITTLAADKPSLLFWRKGRDMCIYRNTESIRFSTLEELHAIIDRVENDFIKEMQKLNSYFNVEGKISESYRRAYKLIGIN